MNNFIKQLAQRFHIVLFVLLEAVALILVFNNSFYQQSGMYNIAQNFQYRYNTMREHFAEYLWLKEDNLRLSAENAYLRNKLQYYGRDTLKQSRIASHRDARYTYIPAKVVNTTTNKQYNYLLLNIDENINVRSDMGIVENNCVVGVIIKPYDRFAVGMSLLNRNTKISSRIKRNGYVGMLMWEGVSSNHATLTEVPQHADVMMGDTVVTSGYSVLFPEGILIGTVVDFRVEKGSYYDVRVRLAVDFNKLRYVELIDNKLQAVQQPIEMQFEF